MINYDDVTKENINEHNPNWTQIPDNLYKISINDFRSGKIHTLLNLTKTYLYVKDLNEEKHQYVIKKCEKMVLKI